jgi:hypothetical protein
MGRFLLGSTVVMLFPKDRCRYNPAWAVRMGEAMADDAARVTRGPEAGGATAAVLRALAGARHPARGVRGQRQRRRRLKAASR